jgi:hypothetical protein
MFTPLFPPFFFSPRPHASSQAASSAEVEKLQANLDASIKAMQRTVQEGLAVTSAKVRAW